MGKPNHYRPPARKEKEGNAAKYVMRAQAIKILQVSLSDFRKFCIHEGVFPGEPKKKVKGNHRTYYHLKDIMYILHDPLLEKFREIRAYKKKIKKSKAKKNDELAKLLTSLAPSYKLDMVIRDRDLDDPLTMVHLFAMLPAIDRLKIEVKLCHEWQAYISRTHKLRKVFVAVKGIYYQAEVDGQKITWLAPHARQQVLTDDIDFNVMLTFLEFYETLLDFVNFQLYLSINVKYPPILDPRLEALAADLYALSRYFDANHRASVQEPQVAGSSVKLKKMELQGTVPRESLLFVILAFGGVVSWEGDGAPFSEADDSITHLIVDRPSQGHVYLSRDYVQPQWVYDCKGTDRLKEPSVKDPSRLMMSRKKRRLAEAIEIGKQRKKDHVERLKERKRNIEAAQKLDKKHKKAQHS
ncbi:Pescadillo-like protein [Hibiscus syriacus]|uniref:Pescadillo-like protein n=1 Tax=Hibiscus syriacus TaxID=106335 RepID=A0A6A3BXE3_HIBSY|nr:Pescadillo-like protein [Hibiscus syriacus]